MTTDNATSVTVSLDPAGDATAVKPGVGRRAALAVTGFLACALPTVFTFNISRMLLTGAESEHRFHQVTGQGLILFALWLGGLLPLLAAGWRGRRPSTGAGLLHLAFVLTGVVCSVLAPGGGAPILMGVIVVTGTLVWAALPKRPLLRGPVRIDALLAPVALLAAAVFTPYAIDQIGLQNAATGYHGQNPHYFDMAWMVLTLVVLSVLSAVYVAARRLVVWVAAGSLVTGAAGLAFGESAALAIAACAVGLVAAAATALHHRLGWDR